MEKKKTQWETIKRVLKYTKKYNMYIAFSLILAAVTVVLTLYLPILTGDAVDLMLGKSAVKFAKDDCNNSIYGTCTVAYEYLQ